MPRAQNSGRGPVEFTSTGRGETPDDRELGFTPCEQPFVGRCRTWPKIRGFRPYVSWHADCNEAGHEPRAVPGRSPADVRSRWLPQGGRADLRRSARGAAASLRLVAGRKPGGGQRRHLDQLHHRWRARKGRRGTEELRQFAAAVRRRHARRCDADHRVRREARQLRCTTVITSAARARSRSARTR